jgi:signal transduction histidine kinase
VLATTDERSFGLTVANEGEAIDLAVRRQLFAVLSRKRPVEPGPSGLYIASEIARAHGGDIDVASSKEETRFTLRIPRT